MSWLMMGDYGAEMLADVIKVRLYPGPASGRIRMHGPSFA